MSAIKKDELEKLEKQYGLEPDGLTYQLRCSRIAAVMKGEKWSKPEPQKPTRSDPKKHPLYGKKLLLTPLMVPDAKRNLAYDEVVGHEMVVREANAGELIYGAKADVDRMMGDYILVSENRAKPITAKTTFPKIGTEISWILGRQLCPVVRGNDGQRGYVWSYPTSCIQIEDTIIQVYGLKTLITNVYPELLEKFSGKPIMTYVDGVTLAASIPQTDALLKQQRLKELAYDRAGLI